MGLWGGVGQLATLLNTVFDKFVPGYKDAPWRKRFKDEKEAKKWRLQEIKDSHERVSRSALRSELAKERASRDS